MLAQRTDQTNADRYVSKRVYHGVQKILKKDAAVNRRAVDDAFARMERCEESDEPKRVAS